jgi:Histone deacetylase domain
VLLTNEVLRQLHSVYNCMLSLVLVHSSTLMMQYSHSKQGIARVCVVDFDVHHGNGTEDLLCRVYDPVFFYASVHAYGFAVRLNATVQQLLVVVALPVTAQ